MAWLGIKRGGGRSEKIVRICGEERVTFARVSETSATGTPLWQQMHFPLPLIRSENYFAPISPDVFSHPTKKCTVPDSRESNLYLYFLYKKNHTPFILSLRLRFRYFNNSELSS